MTHGRSRGFGPRIASLPSTHKTPAQFLRIEVTMTRLTIACCLVFSLSVRAVGQDVPADHSPELPPAATIEIADEPTGISPQALLPEPLTKR